VLIEIFDLVDTDFVETIRKTQSYDELVQALEPNGVRLSFDKKIWMTKVHLDYAKVKQILRNLVTNAFKHKSTFVEIAGKIVENKLFLKIKDDGKGIPVANQQKIFETYFTTGSSIENAIESHGLGLAGVMILLKDMGGTLALDSEHDQGAEFIVTIPL
jgi:K+-sensing histidine kinase KdpD